MNVPCAAEFLLRYVSPGSHSLALFSGERNNVTKWAYAKVFVANRNLTVPLAMALPQDLTGQIIGPASSSNFSVRSQVLDLLTPCCKSFNPDTRGRFTIPSLGWPRHVLAIEALNPASYVKEIRYNNQTVTDNVIELAPGAALTITADDGAATVQGKVQGAKAGEAAIFLTRWPRGSHPNTLVPAPPFQQLALVAPDGTYQVPSLAPGEYRIAAIPFLRAPNFLASVLFDRVIAQAEAITLERNTTKTIDLKLADLSN